MISLSTLVLSNGIKFCNMREIGMRKKERLTRPIHALIEAS